MEKSFFVDKLKVRISQTNSQLGEIAAAQVESIIRDAIRQKGEARVIFASAPSQNSFLEALKMLHIEWAKVHAFIQDEYLGASLQDAYSIGKYIKDQFFSQVPIVHVDYLNGAADDIKLELERYTALIQDAPIDVICLGIGENGHIAFNEPHEADFKDKDFFKKITLDEKCRIQQFNDFGFETINDVPEFGLTLTIPAILSCNNLVCIVPGQRKAEAVRCTLLGEVTEMCPASIMRCHDHATLYLDKDSAKLL